MEPYFREITLEDFEELVPKHPFSSNRVDPCLLIPFVGSGKEFREEFNPSDVAVVAENSHLDLNLGKDNEELENIIVHSKHDMQECKDNEELENNIVHSKHDVQEGSDFLGGNMELLSTNGTTEECEQDMQEVILQQEEQQIEIELDQGRSNGVVLPQCRNDSVTPLNWLLGARNRFVLTSERPNKKRKLLGEDAGLEQLVLLPTLEGEAGSSCDVCCLGESGMVSNRMLHCNSCKVSVHQKCYGVHVVPDGYWLCAWCKSIRSARRLTRSDAGRTVLMPCVLCPKEKGALKPVKWEPGRTAYGGNLEFVHLFCSLWAPEFLVEDTETMAPVTNIGDVQENRTKLVCSLCKVMHGACVRCSHGTCRTCFHPICARESKYQMEIWGKSGHNNVEMRAFCSKHSTVRGTHSIHDGNSAAEQDTTQVDLDDADLITVKKQQLRPTDKNNEKFTNNATISSSSSSLNILQATELVTSPSTVRSIESQENQNTDMVVDRPTGDGNLMSNSGDVSTVLRKLIDQGKVSVGDIESQLGFSSESLEAALVPETTTFSPGLKLKIIKLLQNSVHVPSVQVESLKEDSVRPQGTLLRSESKNLTDTQLGSELEEGISSFDHCFPEDVKANKDWADSVENGIHNCLDYADQISGQRFLNFDGYRCYIHPFLEKMVRNLWDHILNQNDQPTYYHEELSCLHDQNHGGSSTKFEQLTNIFVADQASKVESSGILEHSPHDEIEGEIVYLQSRLLNDVVATRQRYEDFILKVIQSLSHDLDAFNKRKWDHIITNQFLRDIREAKKRGNTERRHKEAQAILAAAAPSVTSTQRNATVRKGSENDVISVKQESIPKVNTGSSRVRQLTSLPQSKDPSFSNSKVSADASFAIFDLAKFSKKNTLPCDVCMRCETVLNRIFVCSNCKAAVHLGCYQSLMNPAGPWKCELCQEMSSEAVIPDSQSDCSGVKLYLVHCGFCHGTSGAFRKTTKGQWVHAFCAEWLLESMFTRGQCNAVDGMESLLKDKDTCSICFRKVGTCLKCNTVGCQITFHPACARDAGLYMNTKKIGSVLRHKAYCGTHSIEQRKADCQQYGPVEVKSLKQMRVKLELLRFLCERIVKREKEKKDLVVCEHDILAARRDSVALSMRTSHYASEPGASSESATTSVNNNSFSGTMQKSIDATVRSDDVTVDSTISRKHTVRFSMHNRDTDRNTADSSTSTISYKRKLDDGDSLDDKNLPERAPIASHKSEDGETKSMDKKNQHPPKRLVYTRRSSLSKKKQLSQGVLEGPGG